MTTSTTDLETSLKSRLEELRTQILKDPLANPVRQLAHELSVRIEKDEISLADLSGLVKALSDDAFASRAGYLSTYLGMDEQRESGVALRKTVRKISERFTTAEEFAAYWQRCRDIAVFTAHPTFILSAKQRELLIKAATEPAFDLRGSLKDVVHHPDTNITLAYEHGAVLDAMKNGTRALSTLTRIVLEEARERFPDQWQTILPTPVKIASWVGYDMDGRNDIGWNDVIRHRLIEKKFRLDYYVEELAVLAKDGYDVAAVTETATAARDHTDKAVTLFAMFDDSPKTLAAAADHLTEDGPGRLTSIEPMLAQMDEAITAAGDDCLPLIALKSSMKSFGLGAGEIHFRLNASQIRNAARNILNLVSDDDLFGRRALERVKEEIEKTDAVDVNFASLAIEKSSASRLLIAMAQIVKHIDADQPIRLLIAECENPVTVLACIYLGKQFGVEKKIDICPLFETAKALDRSRRILDVLLGQEIYRDYANGRGRVAIQAGFSDAGRFMGQIPATLAIERLQGHFAQLIHKHGLGHLDAIVFDTHGESMGRGNHQKSFSDRSLYALSPWARHEFASRGIHLIQESSFQGGDGYVLFGSEPLAEAVVNGLLNAHLEAEEAMKSEDLFYEDTATSLDFYRTVKARQEDMFADKAYHATLSALGLSLLPTTGSRKAKRQFERRSDEDISLRKIRAIPHNAILQQMGLLANLIGGVGQALSTEQDYFVTLNESSDRFHRLMTLVARAKSLSEIKTMIAYMKLFDGSFWATRPLSGNEHDLEKPCAELASLLASDGRYFSALQLAARLRSDSIALGQALTEMGLRSGTAEVPLSLDVLHAVRIALIQHLFIMVAKLPTFSPQTGHSKQDVIEMIFHLDVPSATDLLHEIFPTDAPRIGDFSLKENATYPDNSAEPKYIRLQREMVDPMEETYGLLMRITNGISHYFGAIG
ncbi:phosphoenolpyruvate carboxylase [Aquisalinus flavus]|uniref:Phosphoenolpyruvate carboxylase n=1 Tax=Aquisalinus flavus TaxID=1526572 RepID=A0A8J2V1I6_9PROT|nr:phosphoenolpyruvate carboxylase [Aquisalinus flavus]MBD0427257.1 phosphoenolpyruvate carboxylase [Aquisalinus flavus]UNE47071.1 phosphoenolpyruvate carboxylase [Aquisalinus flavus]GGC99559.1 hypothetical protein GCM10011342_05710 [Aquisalinus flavus]